MTNTPNVQPGVFSEVSFTPDSVVKLSLARFPNETEAASYGKRLLAYGSRLAEHMPTAVAPILGATVVKGETAKFQLQHEMPLIPGPNVARLSPDRQRPIIAGLIADVVSAQAQGNPPRLRTPFDAKAANFQLDADGRPVLVDLFPAFDWGSDGLVHSGLPPSNILDENPYTYMLNFGLKAGAIARLATGTIAYKPGPRLPQLTRYTLTRSWYAELLPTDMPPLMRIEVGMQIKRLLESERKLLLRGQDATAARKITKRSANPRLL